MEIFADEAHKRLHVVHQILQHAQFIVSSVLHKYAQNQVTLLVHISPTMFVPDFVHSHNLTHVCDMLIVVISDGRHKPISTFFYITSNTLSCNILQSAIHVHAKTQ